MARGREGKGWACVRGSKGTWGEERRLKEGKMEGNVKEEGEKKRSEGK